MVSESIGSEVSVSVEPRIAILGVGGAGCNVLSSLRVYSDTVDTIAINTDKAALRETLADHKIYICKEVTKGEGTGGDVNLGKKCAKIHSEEIAEALMGYDAAFIIAGLGGGTGAGALPVIAEICDRINVKACVIAVNPFFFESARVAVAGESLRAVRSICPDTFVIENDHALEIHGDLSIDAAMSAVNCNITGLVLDMIKRMPFIVHDDSDQDSRLLLPEISEHMVRLGLKA